ncbi:SUF system NifU family Fe-S cluster assembly protein [Lujinxingia litoralis]|uniref:SUF system NifU family Fe-S cluster assembly protein n=1 Tax=Lujinxingia litoralis TaxID=2211119 RepID=A0A328CAR6_9DELT|nr:SUF system NifU family Fe-S cluster assembly protein [Lujinxingia litoralis]RAL25252.1 SUF system NifU family Fe-S cluster assembly protein [Lujinxingia litoralis]
MSDMRALYQEVILDHNRKPRNFGPLEGANRVAQGTNPLCGDNYTIYARVNDDNIVEAVSFEGSGCAISKAAASMMTTRIKGKKIESAETLIDEFRRMLTGEIDLSGEHGLGHLTVFEGVSQLPQRVKCAVLPWHAMHAALQGQDEASTEGESDVWSKE